MPTDQGLTLQQMRSQGAVFGVGDNAPNVMPDYSTDWTSFGKRGTRPDFRSKIVQPLVQRGYRLGVYDFNQGHHYAANDPHLDGRAMDVDTVNGESVGTRPTPGVLRFVNDALAVHSDAHVGVPQAVYDAFKGDKSRLFVDAPNHVHVELRQNGGTEGGGGGGGSADQGLTPQQMRQPAKGDGLTMQQMQTKPVPKPPPTIWDRARDMLGAASRFGTELERGTRPTTLAGQAFAGARAAFDDMARRSQGIPGLALDVLSTGQRGIGEYVTSIDERAALAQATHRQMNASDVGTAVRNAAHAAFMDPSDAEVARETAGWEKHVGLPSHAEFDAFIKQHFPPMWAPYVQAMTKGLEDFEVQTATDPLTYLGGFGIVAKAPKGAEAVLAALRTARQMMGNSQAVRAFAVVAGKLGMTKWVPILERIGQTFEAAAAGAGKGLREMGGQRPDLDPFFQGDHKKVRIQVENRRFNEHDQHIAANERAVQAGLPDARNQWLQYVYKYGNAQKSAQAARLLNLPANPRATGWLTGVGKTTMAGLQDFSRMNPQDQLAALRRIAVQVRKGGIATDTQDLIHQGQLALHPNLTQHPSAAPVDVRKIPIQSKLAGLSGISENPIAKGVLQPFRYLYTAGVYSLPGTLVHGLRNLGELAYATGGLDVIPGAMINSRGLSAAQTSRLVSMGSGTGHLASTENLLEHVPWGKIPAYRNYVHWANGILQKMEMGWRQSLLDKLDRTWGPSKDFRDELLKGYAIEDTVGNYRNQNAFAQLVGALGGQFALFHFGIVPRNVLKALTQHPERLEAMLRIQYDIQHNRSQAGQQANSINFGGPLESGLDPDYYLSPGSFGLIGQIMQLHEQSNVGPMTKMYRTATRMAPGVGDYQKIVGDPWVNKSAMSGPGKNMQQMTPADSIMMTILGTLGGYMRKKPDPKTLRSDYRKELHQSP